MPVDDTAKNGGDHLPDILATMRIVPVNQPQIKLPADNYPNPFQIPISTNCLLKSDTDRIFGSKCRCPNANKNSSPPSKSSHRFLEHSIMNQKVFKQRKRSDQKLLKEPTLRLIEECMLHHAPKSLDPSTANGSTDPRCTSIASTSSSSVQDRLSSGFKNWNLDGSLADFKSLVKDCESLTLSSPTPDLHKTRSFRTHQVKTTTSSIPPSSSTHRSLLCDDLKEAEAGAAPSTSSGEAPESGSQNPTQPTCSQQALMNEANCDVTIDELASYFETFVHIPKKMSTMAEMMYI